MEMETSAVPPKPPRLMIEEDALVSQVLEIIGGVTLGALQTLEEVEERDVWVMEEEEGDDSVFYSDEEQARQDFREHTAGRCGASQGRKHVNSVAAEEEEREDGSGGGKHSTRGEAEVTLQAVSKHLDEVEVTAGACRESMQPVLQTQPEQNTSAEKGRRNLQLCFTSEGLVYSPTISLLYSESTRRAGWGRCSATHTPSKARVL